MDFTLLLQRKWKLVIRQWHLHHYFRPDTVKNSCSSSKIKNKKNSFSICICRVISNFLLQKMTTVTYLPNGCKDAMNMLNSPQLNRFTSKRIQVIFSYNNIVPNPKTGSLVLMRSTSSAVSKLQTLMVQSLDPDMMYVPNG